MRTNQTEQAQSRTRRFFNWLFLTPRHAPGRELHFADLADIRIP